MYMYLFNFFPVHQYTFFKLLIFSEASRYLVEILTPVDDEDKNEWLDKIIEIVQKQPCKLHPCSETAM